MTLYIWLTLLLTLVFSNPTALAQQTQWKSDLDYSKRASIYGRKQNLPLSLQYSLKALREARTLQNNRAQTLALEQIRFQLHTLQLIFESNRQWNWAEQATILLLDVDSKTPPTRGDLSVSTANIVMDYEKQAKYVAMQGRTSEGQKYAAWAKELKEKPFKEAMRKYKASQEESQRRIEAEKRARSKIRETTNEEIDKGTSQEPN